MSPAERAAAVREAVNDALLTADAKNRAVRVLLNVVIISAFIDVYPTVDKWLLEGGELDVRALAKAAARAGLSAVFAYVMRRYGDASRIPTPLPPTPAGQPADPAVVAVLDNNLELGGGVELAGAAVHVDVAEEPIVALETPPPGYVPDPDVEAELDRIAEGGPEPDGVKGYGGVVSRGR